MPIVRAASIIATLLLVAATGAASDEDFAEIDSCVSANAPEQTLVQDSRITSFDRGGADRTQEGKIYWKRTRDDLSQVYIHIEAPPDLRDSRFLMIQQRDRPDDMWMYLPEIRKVRRITPRTVSGQLFGTDFSYEDIQHIQLSMETGSRRRLADAEVEGRPTWVVESTPAAESGSSYSRIVAFIDREYCLPIRSEFFEGDDLRKVMTADPSRVTKEGDTFVPREVVMKDLHRETESRITVEKVGVDAEVPDRRFTLSQLERGR